jgi:hypothetical protein
MQNKILISQKRIIFREEDRRLWLNELKKEKPFQTNQTIFPKIVPFYNRQEIIKKAKERPNRYFRECCVLRESSSVYNKGYYTHSIHLFYSKTWQKDGCSFKKDFQIEMFNDFHNKKYFPPEILKEAQERFLKSEYLKKKKIFPKLPDVWLVNNYPSSLFVEVKGFSEPLQEGQKEGLAIIKKYLNSDVCIARVFSEKEGNQELMFQDVDITEIHNKI